MHNENNVWANTIESLANLLHIWQILQLLRRLIAAIEATYRSYMLQRMSYSYRD